MRLGSGFVLGLGAGLLTALLVLLPLASRLGGGGGGGGLGGGGLGGGGSLLGARLLASRAAGGGLGEMSRAASEPLCMSAQGLRVVEPVCAGCPPRGLGGVLSAAHCCALCAARPGCTSWSWLGAQQACTLHGGALRAPPQFELLTDAKAALREDAYAGVRPAEIPPGAAPAAARCEAEYEPRACLPGSWGGEEAGFGGCERVPGLCADLAPMFRACTWWSAGRLVLRPAGGGGGGGGGAEPRGPPPAACAYAAGEVARPCGAYCCSPTGLLGGVDEAGVFRPAECALHDYSRADALGCLRGRVLLFVGDSMMRQLFMRLVASLRGLGPVAEHYFHTDALYWQSVSGEDAFAVGPSVEALLLRAAESGAPPLSRLTLAFVWAATYDEIDVSRLMRLGGHALGHGAGAPLLAALVLGLTYHERHALRAADKFGALGAWLGSQPSLQLLWLNTPELDAAKSYKFIMHGPPPNDEYRKRNEVFHGWVTQENKRLGRTQLHYVDVDALDRSRAFAKLAKDDIHFGCIVAPLYPQQQALLNTPPSAPENGTCAGALNANLASLVLNTLCNGAPPEPTPPRGAGEEWGGQVDV